MTGGAREASTPRYFNTPEIEGWPFGGRACPGSRILPRAAPEPGNSGTRERASPPPSPPPPPRTRELGNSGKFPSSLAVFPNPGIPGTRELWHVPEFPDGRDLGTRREFQNFPEFQRFGGNSSIWELGISGMFPNSGDRRTRELPQGIWESSQIPKFPSFEEGGEGAIFFFCFFFF